MGTALALSLLLSACAGMPPPSTQLPEPSRDAEGLLLIVHGYRNNPSHWPARLIGEIREHVAAADDWDMYAYDWEETANRPLTAARRGYAGGEILAEDLLAAGDPYPVVHLVGQSLGAHVAHGFIDTYQDHGGGAYLHATFLEPFLIRGLLGFGWGVRNFGRGADFAENYVVTDDPALGTNRYLRHAHNFDVSAQVPARMREEFVGPHWWVVRYYRDTVEEGDSARGSMPQGAAGFGLSPMRRTQASALHRRYPPGGVTVLE
jgi:alpha-beta hydrolase superfamily lysophospholipase